MLHQFGLVDLYAHEGVVFPRPYVDDWDNMGGTYDNVHPLIWSKQRAGWPAAHGDTVTFIPRPAPGASYSGTNPLPLFRNPQRPRIARPSRSASPRGRATVAAENAFYYVEARGNTGNNYDSGLPQLACSSTTSTSWSRRARARSSCATRTSLTQTLDDAFFESATWSTIPGTGITITVLAGTGGAPFDIQVDYTAPVTDYNVSITRGDTINGQFYDWFSPDIWVDSPKNGWNQGAGPPPHDQREQPVAGMVNRLYARFQNAGPATAFDFDVRFRISEPYHTVGGEADFDKFVGMKHVDQPRSRRADRVHRLDARHRRQPHACVKVDLINLVGTDTNANDNWAQENLETVTSVTASPFHPVTYSYNLTNPYRSRACSTSEPRACRMAGGGSAAAEDPAGSGRADHRAGDHHAAQGRRAVHVRVDRGD